MIIAVTQAVSKVTDLCPSCNVMLGVVVESGSETHTASRSRLTTHTPHSDHRLTHFTKKVIYHPGKQLLTAAPSASGASDETLPFAHCIHLFIDFY